MRIDKEQTINLVIITMMLFAWIGFLILNVHSVSIITPSDDVLFNCTALCIQQFENATKNVYISPELRAQVERYCFKSCGG